MTNDTNDPLRGRIAAAARVAAIHDIFDGIRLALAGQVDELTHGAPVTSKALLTKLGELQSAQLLLTKAEDAFAEKYGRDGDDAQIDYDELRDQIGRKLDRIRISGGASGLFEGPDTGADHGAAASV